MLKNIKDYVEKKLNRSVDIKELRNAIDSAVKNIIKNFIDVNVLALFDQGGQLKHITRAIILEYNRTTVFGITPENKKTWLGTYDTPEEAEKIRDRINRQIAELGEVIEIP